MRVFKVILPLVLAIVMVLSFSMPIHAATSDTVVITNSPQFISISIAPAVYTLDGADGKGVKPSTTYYTQPLQADMETSPTVGGALDAECAFTITNTSNIATDMTVTSSDMAGGSDNSTNSDTGAAGATTYGAKSYFSGQAAAAWVVAKTAASATGYSNLAATTDIKFGMIIAEQTDAWTGGTPATFDVVVTATAH